MHQRQGWKFILLLVIATIMATAGMPTAPGVSIASDGSPLEQAALKEINSIPIPHKACGTLFEIGEIRQDGQWGFVTLVCWPRRGEEPVEVVVPAVILFAIAYYDGSAWDVYLEGTEDYLAKLADLPGSLLSSESREQLLASSLDPLDPAVLTSAQAISTGLPWQQGNTWYYRTSIHGSNNALDFASPCGTVGEVRAADNGIIVWAYETCMLVRRGSDGLQIGYQHIEPADIAKWRAGDRVYQGNKLGSTTLTYGCGGRSYAHHVHFWLQGVNPNGATFGGWTLEDPWLVKGDVRRYPNLGCVAGVNDIFYEGTCCGCLPANCCSEVMAQAGGFPNTIRWGDPGIWFSTALSTQAESGTPGPAELDEPPTILAAEAESVPTEASVSRERDAAGVAGLLDPEPNGTETVYAQLRDDAGNVSSVYSASILVELNATKPSSANYRLVKSVFGTGGGPKASTAYSLRGTSGQPMSVGRRESSSYVLRSGYWSGPLSAAYFDVYLPLVLKEY